MFRYSATNTDRLDTFFALRYRFKRESDPKPGSVKYAPLPLLSYCTLGYGIA